MAGVSVSMAAIQQAESICMTAIQELNNSAQRLNARYQEAGERWKDVKYKELGGIINDCSRAMKSPIDELFECVAKLRELEKAIVEYDSTSF